MSRPSRRQEGETLVELLVAVMLLGTVVVSLLGAFGTLIKTSNAGRRTTDASYVLAAAADAVADNERNPYQSTCPAAYDPLAGVTLPTTVDATEVSVDSVRYWNGSAFVPECPAADLPALRLQLLTVRVRTTAADRTIEVVKRG